MKFIEVRGAIVGTSNMVKQDVHVNPRHVVMVQTGGQSVILTLIDGTVVSSTEVSLPGILALLEDA